MEDSASAPPAAPWRLLLLDRSAEDPKWIIATVVSGSDVRPAELDEVGQVLPGDLLEAVGWASERTGNPVVLYKIFPCPQAWVVNGQGGEPLPPAAAEPGTTE